MSLITLEEAVDRLGSVPEDLKRAMELIKDLDRQWLHKIKRLKDMQTAYLDRVRSAVRGKPRDGSVDLAKLTEDPAGLAAIRETRRECAQLAEEKVSLAQQAYDLIEGHLAKLDSDLRGYKEVIGPARPPPRASSAAAMAVDDYDEDEAAYIDDGDYGDYGVAPPRKRQSVGVAGGGYNKAFGAQKAAGGGGGGGYAPAAGAAAVGGAGASAAGGGGGVGGQRMPAPLPPAALPAGGAGGAPPGLKRQGSTAMAVDGGGTASAYGSHNDLTALPGALQQGAGGMGGGGLGIQVGAGGGGALPPTAPSPFSGGQGGGFQQQQGPLGGGGGPLASPMAETPSVGGGGFGRGVAATPYGGGGQNSAALQAQAALAHAHAAAAVDVSMHGSAAGATAGAAGGGDSSDETWCICAKPSFGEMVGCDSDTCAIEWFHLGCVGLAKAPPGKWSCPDCTAIARSAARGPFKKGARK